MPPILNLPNSLTGLLPKISVWMRLKSQLKHGALISTGPDLNLESIISFIIENPGSAFFYTPPGFRNSRSYIFKRPQLKIEAFNKDSFFSLLNKVTELRQKYTGYGYINYVAGFLTEDKLSPLSGGNDIISRIYFAGKNDVEILPSSSIDPGFSSEGKSNYTISSFGINTPRNKYLNDVAEIKKLHKERGYIPG